MNHPLSEFQSKVWAMLAHGLTNQQIADRLGSTTGSVNQAIVFIRLKKDIGPGRGALVLAAISESMTR